MINTTIINIKTKVGLVVDNVPELLATILCCPILPAIAIIAIIGRKREMIIATANKTLKIMVLPLNPPKLEPLFAPADEKAYKNSENPCAPLLLRLVKVLFNIAGIALQVKIAIGVDRQAITAIRIS